MTGCEAAARDIADGDDPGSVAVSDPGPAFEGADWDSWTGVYSDVRPASDEDVAELRARVAERNATSWTATDAEDQGAEVHLDPSREPYVLCAEGECVRIGPDAEVKGPHVTNNALDSMTFVVQSLVYWQRHDGAVRLVDPMVRATVDTPVGPLDCLVRGQSEDDLDDLEGASAVPDPDASPADGPRLAPWCVDQRGLVTRTEDVMTPVILYSSWQEGVDGDIETYPAPVVDYNDL